MYRRNSHKKCPPRVAVAVFLIAVVRALTSCSQDPTQPPFEETPNSPALVHSWSYGVGDDMEQVGRSVAIDGTGGIVVTGDFKGSIDFGGSVMIAAGDQDIFLTKYDASGSHMWSRRFGGSGSARPQHVAVGPAGSIYLTGSFNGAVDLGGGMLTTTGESDGFIAKYDASGGHLWSYRIGGPGADFVVRHAVDDLGDVTLTGSFRDSVDFGNGTVTSAGSSDIFVSRYSSDGHRSWSVQFGGLGGDNGAGVTIDAAGDIVLTGSFSHVVDLGGGELTSLGNTDVFVAKYTQNGAHVWSRPFGGPGGDYGSRVKVTGTNEIVVNGSFEFSVDFGGGELTSAGLADVFLLKLSSSGDHIWSRSFGGTSVEINGGVDVGANGDVFLHATYSGSADFGNGTIGGGGMANMVLARYNQGGVHRWSTNIGGLDLERAYGLAVGAAGNAVITGVFRGTVDFGGGPLVSDNVGDVYVANYVPRDEQSN